MARRIYIIQMLSVCLFLLLSPAFEPPQSVSGTAGTIEGVVTDPTGAVIPGASVEISYRISGFTMSTTTDAAGAFHFNLVPFNPYHLTVTATGFQKLTRDVMVRSAVPVALKLKLPLATEQTAITVHSDSGDLLERVPSAHTDMDRELFKRLPTTAPGAGLSDVLTLGSPGVVADSNGFFHPMGEHAGTGFSLDGQPITDQQSKNYTNQLPVNALQSIEAITGAVPAEYGGKTSMVVNAQTRSGLGLTKPTGSLQAYYGSFGTIGEQFSFGLGGNRWGNFLTANTSRSGRFLDTPEFRPLHDIGNDWKLFDRFDLQPSTYDTLHLDAFGARTWFQVPNTYDQQAAGQDQRQLIYTVNVAPGWVHLFGANTSFAFTPYFRQDRVHYYPSRDPESDQPATISQNRRLTNLGAKADISHVHGRHDFKAGAALQHTLLTEAFALRGTNPELEIPGLDGRPFVFNGHADIREQAAYVQDSVTLGAATVMGGLRLDHYDGLSQTTALQPRLGLSYLIRPSGTVLRASYTRLLETPYNENLVLSSSTGVGGLAGSLGAFGQAPLEPGRRNQFNVGLQQAIDRHVRVDADYFWKFTRNAFDFDALFDTPIAFPIGWRKSKVDGLAMRITLAEVHGFSAFTVLGHTRARVFGPEVGGLLFNSPIDAGVFRIDHDQAFEQTTHLLYRFGKDGRPWVAFTWRYDSGMVAGVVPDYATALTFTADQQAAMGLFCGSAMATLGRPIRACSAPDFGALRVRIPATGTYDPDRNPARIAPRHIFDASVGSDNLFHTDYPRYTLRLSVFNLTNREALYNFLSTFSGTHFVQPRTWQAQVGITF